MKERPLKHITRNISLEQSSDVSNNNSSSLPPTARIGGATIFSTVPSTRLEGLSRAGTNTKSHVDGMEKVKSFSISKTEKELLNEKDLKNGNNEIISASSRSGDPDTPAKLSSVDLNFNPVVSDGSKPLSTPSKEAELKTSTVITPSGQTINTGILRRKPQLPPLVNTPLSSSDHRDQGGELHMICLNFIPWWRKEFSHCEYCCWQETVIPGNEHLASIFGGPLKE